jgi:hypothetical protein
MLKLNRDVFAVLLISSAWIMAYADAHAIIRKMTAINAEENFCSIKFWFFVLVAILVAKLKIILKILKNGTSSKVDSY